MLRGKIALIVDAGPSSVGIESTVVDLTVEPVQVLRAGMISASHIANVERGRIVSMGGVVSLIWLVILVLMVWNA